MQSHPAHHQPSYFLTPQVAANTRKSASPAANCSLRRLDEETPPPPHLTSSERKRKWGRRFCRPYTLYLWGHVARLFKESRYSAGVREHLWEAILEKNGNGCKLEMHFYDIVYQHEYSAWLLQAILIAPKNNRATNWQFKHQNLTKLYYMQKSTKGWVMFLKKSQFCFLNDETYKKKGLQRTVLACFVFFKKS